MKTLPGLLFAAIIVLASFGALIHGLTPDGGPPVVTRGGNQTVRTDDPCHCKVRGDGMDAMEFGTIYINEVTNEKCETACKAEWDEELQGGDLNKGPGQVLCDSLDRRGTPNFGPAPVYLCYKAHAQIWNEVKDTHSKQPLECYNGQYVPSDSAVSPAEH